MNKFFITLAPDDHFRNRIGGDGAFEGVAVVDLEEQELQLEHRQFERFCAFQSKNIRPTDTWPTLENETTHETTEYLQHVTTERRAE
jgi:hypothetical protein